MNTSSKFVVSVHILTLLAGRRYVFGEENGLNSEDIAQSVGTNAVVIRRLLSILRSKSIVGSKMGPNGGFFLINDPSTIKLSQVYDIVEEGNLFHMHYSSPNPICPVGGHIKENLQSILCKAEDSFKMVLETKSLQDILYGIIEKVEDFKGKSRKELADHWDKTLEQMNNQSSIPIEN